MEMSPWLAIVLFGTAVFGFAWLTPRSRAEDSGIGGADPAYDRLLEDLETENRELVDAVAKFKQEQDDTVNRLVKQIVELERQMKALAERPQASASAAANVAEAAAATDDSPRQNTASALPGTPAQAEAEAVPAEQKVRETHALAPSSIRMRYAELLTLHGKGRSVEQIAKSVGMNKGEVQLILQLARREEQQHA